MSQLHKMSQLHHDPVFAPVDIDLHLERIGGGNETEVYCTDDRRYVVKVKSEHIGSLAAMLARARQLRKAARRFATVMGREHQIENYFLVAANAQGKAQLLALQPFHEEAIPLFRIHYAQLPVAERLHLAKQLLQIIYRSLGAYKKRGWMPDLYGRTSLSNRDRAEKNRWYLFPQRLWSFVGQRNLLRAHNLMYTPSKSTLSQSRLSQNRTTTASAARAVHSSSGHVDQPRGRIILVDYDPVARGKLYQQVYYAVRALLFARDLVLLALMVLTGWVPPGA